MHTRKAISKYTETSRQNRLTAVCTHNNRTVADCRVTSTLTLNRITRQLGRDTTEQAPTYNAATAKRGEHDYYHYGIWVPHGHDRDELTYWTRD